MELIQSEAFPRPIKVGLQNHNHEDGEYSDLYLGRYEDDVIYSALIGARWNHGGNDSGKKYLAL